MRDQESGEADHGCSYGSDPVSVEGFKGKAEGNSAPSDEYGR